jgi:cell division protein FtsL
VTPSAEGHAVRARARQAPGALPLRDEPGNRHLRVVDERAARRERQMRLGIWMFGLVSVVSVFVVVALHVMVAQSQIQLDRLSQQNAKQKDRYEQLRLEVASLSAPQRITKRAAELGMQPGGPSVFITVPDSGTVPSAPETTSSTADYQKVKPHLGTQP